VTYTSPAPRSRMAGASARQHGRLPLLHCQVVLGNGVGPDLFVRAAAVSQHQKVDDSTDHHRPVLQRAAQHTVADRRSRCRPPPLVVTAKVSSEEPMQLLAQRGAEAEARACTCKRRLGAAHVRSIFTHAASCEESIRGRTGRACGLVARIFFPKQRSPPTLASSSNHRLKDSITPSQVHI
jgi:hypothetical protein